MFNDFKLNHPDGKVCYETYRKAVSSQNISFAKLGSEECEVCLTSNLHKSSKTHKNDKEASECELCKIFTMHKIKAGKAREEYNNDRSKATTDEEICCQLICKISLCCQGCLE